MPPLADTSTAPIPVAATPGLEPACEQVASTLVINEVLVTHNLLEPDTWDCKEFLEILGPPDMVLDGLSVVLVEGQTAQRGQIDTVFSLSGSIPSDGYYVIGDTRLDESPAPIFDTPELDMGATYIYENGSQTVLLVDSYVAPPGTPPDLDADNDGVADVSIGIIVDAVGLVGGSGYPDYSIYYGAPEVGPQNGSTIPAGVARIPNGIDTDTSADWDFLSYALDGSDGDKEVTPGWANSGVGDFDGDGDVDLEDFWAFQECFTGADNGPPATGCEGGDIDADDDCDYSDLDLFDVLLTGP